MEQESVLAVRPIPSDLAHPGSVGRIDHSRDLDPTCLEVDHEQHEVPNEASPRDRFDRKEISRRDRSPMCLQEGLLTRWPASSRIDSILREDSLDRASADGVPEIRESALDPGVAPSRIVARHLDQPLDLAGDPRSAGTASCAPVIFLGNELAVPPEQGIRSDDR
jgi:hypothetical protein